MYSSPSAGGSVDNLTPLSPGGRADYPFHRWAFFSELRGEKLVADAMQQSNRPGPPAAALEKEFHSQLNPFNRRDFGYIAEQRLRCCI